MLKKSLKFISKTLAWLIALTTVTVIIAYLTVGFWIKPLINQFVSPLTKTSVFLEKVDVSLLSGKLSLQGLKIANPADFKEPFAFELDEFSIQFQPKSVFTDKIIVDKVLIKGTQITAELNAKAQTNLMVISQNVQNALTPVAQKSTTAESNSAKKTESAKKMVVIKDLQILDTKLHFALMGKVSTISIPNIYEKNIGEKKDISLKQSLELLINKLTSESFNEMKNSTQNLLKGALDEVSKRTGKNEAVQSLSKAISSFF